MSIKNFVLCFQLTKSEPFLFGNEQWQVEGMNRRALHVSSADREAFICVAGTGRDVGSETARKRGITRSLFSFARGRADAATKEISLPTRRAATQEVINLITKRELAERLHVSQRTIENWMMWGLIPYLQIRNVVRFDEEQVKLALEKYTRRGRRA